MKRSHSILKLLVLAIFLLASSAHSNGIPGWLEPFWMSDPLEPGAQWWRDTTNQNALVQYYYDTYPQVPYVETTVPGVYVVKGIGKSNVVALVGASEWVLVDSMESPTNMQLALLLLNLIPAPSLLRRLFIPVKIIPITAEAVKLPLLFNPGLRLGRVCAGAYR